MKEALKDSVVKYAFVIRNITFEVMGAGGKKRTFMDPPEEDFTIYSRFNLASVTKVIVGLAVVQLLEKKKLGIEDKIYPYLPPYWSIPNSIKALSFRQILTHKSGIRDSDFSFDHAGVKKVIERGVNLSDTGFLYQNYNFAVCRLLIAYLDVYSDAGVTDTAKAVSDRFVNYLQKNIFDPIGISNITFKPIGSDPTLFYPFPPDSAHGTDYGDWSLRGGPAGLLLSVHELADFLTHLRLGKALLSDSMRTIMYDNDLGWDVGNWNMFGDRFHGKGGFFPGTAQLSSQIIDFQNGLQISYVVNCNRSFYVNDAYLK